MLGVKPFTTLFEISIPGVSDSELKKERERQELQRGAKRYKERAKRQDRETMWGKDNWVIIAIAGICSIVLPLIATMVIFHKPQESNNIAINTKKIVKTTVPTDAQVIYHYNMSREDWQDYQYQQSLKDIDAGVRELRMHNATLAAQRQAVVECRGDVEWLALAVPGAKFESTGVPCTKTNK